MHGLDSEIAHGGERLFAGLPSPLQVGRYHSLVVEPTPAMQRSLTIDATSPEGEIMALSHRSQPTWGVQFHPESVLTPAGGRRSSPIFSPWRPRSDATGKVCMVWLDGTLYPHEPRHLRCRRSRPDARRRRVRHIARPSPARWSGATRMSRASSSPRRRWDLPSTLSASRPASMRCSIRRAMARSASPSPAAPARAAWRLRPIRNHRSW